MITEIKLDEFTSIYKIKYDWKYSKDDFIKRTNQIRKFNLNYEIMKNNKVKLVDKKYFYFIFNCEEFVDLNNFVINKCKIIQKSFANEWAIDNWVFVADGYTQSDLEHNRLINDGIISYEWHKHPYVYTNNPLIKTDFTFCFYIQIPDNLIDKEGNIAFKTESGIETFLTPEEGDIIIFSGDLWHTPVGMLSAKNKDRVLIAGNISLNPLETFSKSNLI